MARGYDARVCQNRQPVLSHSHPGQVIVNLCYGANWKIIFIYMYVHVYSKTRIYQTRFLRIHVVYQSVTKART